MKESKKQLRRQAADYILKNLAKYMNKMKLSTAEKKLFNDKLKLENLLRDPVLKLIAIDRPREMLDFKEDR